MKEVIAYVYIFWKILTVVMTTIGMWKLLKKCGIAGKWALIPGYREYKLAESVGMDEEGATLFITLILSYIAEIVHGLLIRFMPPDYSESSIFYPVLTVVLVVIMGVHTYRIIMELCTKFEVARKRRVMWSLLWIAVPMIPILVFGFSKKYQMVQKQNDTEAAAVSGIEEKTLNHGLTINLTDRTVRNRFKKRYLLRDIHMNITPNKMVLLLGGSGAGKTTFLNAITGYEKANAKVSLNGIDIYKNFNRMKYEIGFVPQQDLIRYEDTVQKTLLDAASLRLPTEYSSKEKVQRVKEVLEIFGLTPVRNNLVTKQSGGQKKRISIATEFISDPSLFILDEPDSGLDGILARELMERLHEISRQGKIVMVITHTPDRVIDLFDEVIVLGKDANRTGRLVFHGSIEKAREFFHVERMEQIIRKINCVDEGGEGLTDELIVKFEEVRHGK